MNAVEYIINRTRATFDKYDFKIVKTNEIKGMCRTLMVAENDCRVIEVTFEFRDGFQFGFFEKKEKNNLFFDHLCMKNNLYSKFEAHRKSRLQALPNQMDEELHIIENFKIHFDFLEDHPIIFFSNEEVL